MFTFEQFLAREHGYSLNQIERLVFIDIRLRYLGEVSRADIMNEFRIAQAAASKDLSEYRSLQASQVDIDSQSKKTIIKNENFQPLFKISAQDALSILTGGFSRNYFIKSPAIIPSETIETPLDELESTKIVAITQAIQKDGIISCIYNSSHSSNNEERILFPTTLFKNKSEWYFRAFEYNENESKFKNFKLSRVEKSALINLDNDFKYKIPADIDWNTLIPVQIQVNDKLDDYFKDSIRNEFKITSDIHTLVTKVALFPYIYSNWSIRTEQEIEDKKFAKFKLLNLDLYKNIPSLSEFLHL